MLTAWDNVEELGGVGGCRDIQLDTEVAQLLYSNLLYLDNAHIAELPVLKCDWVRRRCARLTATAVQRAFRAGMVYMPDMHTLIATELMNAGVWF